MGNNHKREYFLDRIEPGCIYIDPIKCKNIIKESVFGDQLILYGDEHIFSWNKLNYRTDTFGLFYRIYHDQCQEFSDDDNAKFAHITGGTQMDNINPNVLELYQMIEFNLISFKEINAIRDCIGEKVKWEDDVLMPDIGDPNLDLLKIFKNNLACPERQRRNRDYTRDTINNHK